MTTTTGGSKELLAGEISAVRDAIAELESSLQAAGEEHSRLAVMRRHMARNPERFAPHERETVFEQAESAAAERSRLEARLESATERLTVLERLRAGLGQGRQGVSALEVARAVEAERLRIARDLHDGPAQVLSNLVLEAEILERMLKRDPGAVEPALQDFRNSVRNAVADMRRFMFELRPDSLDDLGLIATLRRLTSEWQQRTGVTCRLNVTGDERRLGSELEEALYRIVQEALTNVRRHAGAREVEVNVDFGAASVGLRVRDDGAGFDAEEYEAGAVAGKLGLVGMRERAQSAGGTLEVRSRPGAGTDVAGTFRTGE